ncbi:MAG: heme peroxidase family protein [Polyangiaceae bacterium]
MFPDLPPVIHSDADLTALGTTMVAPTQAQPESNIPAVFTYFGQFVDHDITLDTTPLPDVERDPLGLTNFRTPALDLDSVFGGGPKLSPHLYESDHVTLKVGTTEPARGPNTGDLPRDGAGKALLGDGRNDENLIVAQLHLSFLRFYNRIVQRFKDAGTPPLALFQTARRAAVWHYQWVVVHDFLPRIVGPEVITDILDHGRRFYSPTGPKPFMPVEFSVAAYRYGHSMVRQSYKFQVDTDATFPTASIAQFFTFTELFAAGSPSHTIAGTNWPMRPKDWRSFAELSPTAPPQGAAPIDPILALSLGNLPHGDLSSQPNLAVRNLQRGRFYGLPSGQAVATRMGVVPLTPTQVAGGRAIPKSVANLTPLWYYVLREAELVGGGNRLGPVGGRIVAEVLLGLLDADPTSYRHCKRIPILPQPFPVPRRLPEFEVVSLLGRFPKAPLPEVIRPAARAPQFAPAAAAVADIDLRNPEIAEALQIFRCWKPFLGPTPGVFTLADLLRFANEGP